MTDNPEFYSVAGDTRSFTFIGTNDAGEPESIAGDTITFRAYDDVGNEIVLTVGNGITPLTQSGATLGHAKILVEYADYPEAWLAKPMDASTQVKVEIKRITAAGKRRTPEQTTWRIRGQGIQ